MNDSLDRLYRVESRRVFSTLVRLLGTPALAQRIVRANAKIKAAGIPYEVPDDGVTNCTTIQRPICADVVAVSTMPGALP